jgi:hypothetical protein
MNKARLEHDAATHRSKKGKNKQSVFDMASVEVPDLHLSAHSISFDYRDEARIHLDPTSP